MIGIDIFYPVFGTGHQLPFLIIICMLSRYTLACRLAPHKPVDIMDGLFTTWLHPMGRPERIISDKATAFCGPKWGDFLSTFDLEYVASSANTPHENGSVERAAPLVKIGYGTIKRSCAGISHGRAIARARMAKNVTPMVSLGYHLRVKCWGAVTFCNLLKTDNYGQKNNVMSSRCACNLSCNQCLKHGAPLSRKMRPV